MAKFGFGGFLYSKKPEIPIIYPVTKCQRIIEDDNSKAEELVPVISTFFVPLQMLLFEQMRLIKSQNHRQW